MAGVKDWVEYPEYGVDVGVVVLVCLGVGDGREAAGDDGVCSWVGSIG